MAPDNGRHNAEKNSTDRARVEYLAGESDVELDDADQAELDELRALLADPTLWSEPPAELEDSVVALIAAEASATTGSPTSSADPSAAADQADSAPFPRLIPTDDRSTAESGPSSRPGEAPAAPAAPIDLSAARKRKQHRADGGRRFTRPAFLIGAAAAVVAIALSGVLILRDTTSQPRFDVTLSATELAPGASGNAVMLREESGWEITLNATGLPRRENGEFYQAWLRDADGVLVPIGTFNEGIDVVLWGGVNPERFSTMTITLETADGNQDSSGQRVLVGTAVEE